MLAKQLLKGRLFLDCDGCGSDTILIKRYTSERKGRCVCHTINPYVGVPNINILPNTRIKKVLV